MRGIPEAQPGINFILASYDAKTILNALEMNEQEKIKIINNAYDLVTRYLWRLKVLQLLEVVLRLMLAKSD